jgi:hypothetical protein
LLPVRGWFLGALIATLLLPGAGWTQETRQQPESPAPPKVPQGMGGIAGGLGAAPAYLNANGMRQRQDVLSSGSYISSNDRRPHFGLGDATDAGTAEIHWPSGAKETV